LQIRGGAISLNNRRRATLHFSFLKTSLDGLGFAARNRRWQPRQRFGQHHRSARPGPPVGVTVEQADLTLFDYRPEPGDIRIALENNIYKLGGVPAAARFRTDGSLMPAPRRHPGQRQPTAPEDSTHPRRRKADYIR
jgi:hypothetical protein